MEEEQREAIEQRAEAVLAEIPEWIWDGKQLPVPIEAIVDSHFNLLVCDKEPHEMAQAPDCPPVEEGATLSGLFLPLQNEIWVNGEEAREWPARRRFTIGHELGHCVLHRDGQQSLFCRHGSVDVPDDEPSAPGAIPPRGPDTGDDEVLARIEREANQFAAALLMPRRLMRHHYRATGKSFERMCEVFASSGAAMSRRMRQTLP